MDGSRRDTCLISGHFPLRLPHGKSRASAQRCMTGRKLVGIARSAASYNFCRLDFQPALRPDERGQTSGRAPTHPLQVSFARGSRGTTLKKWRWRLISIPDYIITSAKHEMYRHGGMTPTLIVCGTRKT